MRTYVFEVAVDIDDSDDRNEAAIRLWLWNMIRTRPWGDAMFSITKGKKRRRAS